jgi:hypothetical protein
MAKAHKPVRFTPSHAEGLPDVGEVVVHPDRIEVETEGRWVTFALADIARAQEPRALSLLKRMVGKPSWPPLVADRDWFHPARERFFLWYTDPPLKTCMPEDETRDYDTSYFARIRWVVESGGFATYDLG